MIYPMHWQSLPGPSAYVNSIVDSLKQGHLVWAYIPADRMPDRFSTVVQHGMESAGCSKWHRIECEEVARLSLSNDYRVHCCSLPSDGKDFRDTLVQLSEKAHSSGVFPRILVLAHSNDSKSVAELRRREVVDVKVWSEYVTLTDSRVVVERAGHHQGWSRGYTDLMSSIISQVARNDIRKASNLAARSLRDILCDQSLASEDLWVGQVQSLLPEINSWRRRMLKKHANVWAVPFEREDGHIVTRAADLEIGDLSYQASENRNRVDTEDIQLVNRLAKIRNQLAHMKKVDWTVLSDKVTRRAFDLVE